MTWWGSNGRNTIPVRAPMLPSKKRAPPIAHKRPPQASAPGAPRAGPGQAEWLLPAVSAAHDLCSWASSHPGWCVDADRRTEITESLIHEVALGAHLRLEHKPVVADPQAEPRRGAARGTVESKDPGAKPPDPVRADDRRIQPRAERIPGVARYRKRGRVLRDLPRSAPLAQVTCVPAEHGRRVMLYVDPREIRRHEGVPRSDRSRPRRQFLFHAVGVEGVDPILCSQEEPTSARGRQLRDPELGRTARRPSDRDPKVLATREPQLGASARGAAVLHPDPGLPRDRDARRDPGRRLLPFER